MADGATVRTNIPDFRRQMRELGDKIGRKVATRAASRGTAVLRNAARQNARSVAKTGVLARAVYMGRSRFVRGRGVVAYFVSARKGLAQRKVGKKGLSRDAFYWRWVEDGHRIVPRGQSLSGGGQRARGVRRARFDAGGGGRAQPVRYLARAFASASAGAVLAVEAELEAGIKREGG